jgi:cytochrome c oxidase assembly protein subunit 16
MPVFQTNKYRSQAEQVGKVALRYRALLGRHPFLFFGLPFLTVIVAGSFVLTPATAIRYEKHDRKVKQLSREQELDVRRNPRKVNWRDEYHVGFDPDPTRLRTGRRSSAADENLQRLRADKDLENWSQKRVKRLPGEPDGVL